MSEEANSQTGVQSSSPEQKQVPKERLDEVIADRRRLEEQIQVMQHLLRERSPRPAQERVPEQEPEALKKLKEDNPEVYALYKNQEEKNRRLGATTFQMMDQMDKMSFLQTFGKEGEKRLAEVEAKLQELQSRGIHHFNRGQILYNIIGAESFEKMRSGVSDTKPVSKQEEKPAPIGDPSVYDAPSRNPAVAAVAKGSASAPSAATSSATTTLEELEERLKDVVF